MKKATTIKGYLSNDIKKQLTAILEKLLMIDKIKTTNRMYTTLLQIPNSKSLCVGSNI